jgi:hypothetical protein
MNTKEKSAKLAEVMGISYKLYSDVCKFFLDGKLWLAVFPTGWRLGMTDREVIEEYFPDLYDEQYMALAWRVVTEMNRQWENGHDWTDGFFTWWNDAELWRLTADEAQAAWLDKILELAEE